MGIPHVWVRGKADKPFGWTQGQTLLQILNMMGGFKGCRTGSPASTVADQVPSMEPMLPAVQPAAQQACCECQPPVGAVYL